MPSARVTRCFWPTWATRGSSSPSSPTTASSKAAAGGFPSWAVACWAIAVWGSLLGSILLLMRQRLAVAVFGVAIVAMALTTIQNYLLSEGLRIMGSGAAVFSAVIWFIALFLFFYSRAMAARGVLR